MSSRSIRILFWIAVLCGVVGLALAVDAGIRSCVLTRCDLSAGSPGPDAYPFVAALALDVVVWVVAVFFWKESKH